MPARMGSLGAARDQRAVVAKGPRSFVMAVRAAKPPGGAGAALSRAGVVVSMVCPAYNGCGMARGQENPSPVQLVGMASIYRPFLCCRGYWDSAR